MTPPGDPRLELPHPIAKEEAEKVKKKPEEHAKHTIAGEAVVAEDVLVQLGAKALVEHTGTVRKHHEEKWTTCDSSTGNTIRMFLHFIMYPDNTNSAKKKKKKEEEDEIIKKYKAEHAKGKRDACVGTTGKQARMYNLLDEELGLEPGDYSGRIKGIQHDADEIGKCLRDAAKDRFPDKFYWHRPTLELVAQSTKDKKGTKEEAPNGQTSFGITSSSSGLTRFPGNSRIFYASHHRWSLQLSLKN